ncbi:MAG TPA: thiol:disulfide interchange protein DsbA/DsbL [Xanthomonadaceae bacterium]|nr:thiol:disulfide interchange protein DsbA/DsbL [Xanthomonadaceae bacterium]
MTSRLALLPRLGLILAALLPIAACTAEDTPSDAATAATPAATATSDSAAPANSAAASAANQAAAAAAIDPVAAEAALAAAASGSPPVEGTDYVVIPNGEPFDPANGQVEVVEVFGYTCPHCATFQPAIASWKARLPADVRVTYVPAPFGGMWIPYAQAYYTAEALGVADETHDAMFAALHLAGELPIQNATPEEIGRWYAAHADVDADEFAAAMQSFGIDAKLKRAAQFLQRSGVNGTPTLVVNGKYRVTGADPLRIASQLVAMERAAQEGAAGQQ